MQIVLGSAPLIMTCSIQTPRLAFEHSLRKYVPIPTRLCNGEGEFRWMSESRRATVVFIMFPNLLSDIGKYEEDPLDDIQELYGIIQEEIHNYNGVIKEFSADDKGAVVVCAFGISPLVGEEHEMRATLTCISIMQKINELQDQIGALSGTRNGERGGEMHGERWGSSGAPFAYLKRTDSKNMMNMGFGIATGEIFITCFGDALRREFAMVGDIVNSAARTAGIASKGGSILLGQATWDAVHTRVGCVKLPPVKVKGKKQVRVTRERNIRANECIYLQGRLLTLSLFATDTNTCTCVPTLVGSSPVSP